MKLLALPIRMLGTFLVAIVVACFGFYLYLVEGWAKDLDRFQK